ncbi:FtsW/RodA/SpoVE family cell cycle protein [Halobacillus sp. H74]|uniref:FtsW/RodA/SpoVE family cell cycle protein n=1 Tax=Halobacillus sp. H74 TaxID=3457436 RepID=UPI003FCDD5F6
MKSLIKDKDAGQAVTKELDYHIECEIERLLQKGYKLAEAEEEAVRQMGNPIEVGKHFNDIYRPKIDWWLILLLTITIGASFLPVIVFNEEAGYLLNNKVIYTILGVGLVAAFLYFDYRKLRKWGWAFYVTGLSGLFFLILGPVTYIGGSPIILIGPLDLRGIYFLPLFILGFSTMLSSTKASIWKGLFFLSFPVLLYFVMADLPSAFILTVVFITMAWYQNLNRKMIIGLLLGGSGVAGVSGLWLFNAMQSYQQERILAFLYPEEFEGGIYLRMKELLSSAGWTGNFGAENPLSSGHTDFVLVSVTYQFGWIVSIIITLVLLLLMLRVALVNIKIKDSYGRMVVTGGLAFYSVQLLYHLMMSLGLLPVMSFSLPFLSYGLYPTVLNAIVFGLILSVYRKKDLAGMTSPVN